MKRKIFIFLLILIIIYVYKINEQNIFIPNNAIRLRVIPNSNSSDDIYIKELVKDYLEDDIYLITKDIENIDEARNIIKGSIPRIEKSIDNIFTNNKYHLSYTVNYGDNYFPEKVYKGTKYSEGYYESLVISIGEAKGDNWWCVLFPNFCLIDMNEKHEYKSYFKELIKKYSK